MNQYIFRIAVFAIVFSLGFVLVNAGATTVNFWPDGMSCATLFALIAYAGDYIIGLLVAYLARDWLGGSIKLAYFLVIQLVLYWLFATIGIELITNLPTHHLTVAAGAGLLSAIWDGCLLGLVMTLTAQSSVFFILRFWR
jgi:hypothetical protein